MNRTRIRPRCRRSGLSQEHFVLLWKIASQKNYEQIIQRRGASSQEHVVLCERLYLKRRTMNRSCLRRCRRDGSSQEYVVGCGRLDFKRRTMIRSCLDVGAGLRGGWSARAFSDLEIRCPANSTRTKSNFAISLFSFTSAMCSTSFLQSQLQPSTTLFCVFVLWDMLTSKLNWNLQQDLTWRWARAIFFTIVSNAMCCRPI